MLDRVASRLLPPAFLAGVDALADAYLSHSDPIQQSGFGGGPERWRCEREPILDCIDRSGSLIDVGCANGHLLECLVAWGRDRGLGLDPYGLDHSARLIALAQQRLPQWADHFFVGNAWEWMPPRRFDFVYSVYDNVPEAFLAEYVSRLLTHFATPGGRLIIGAYGSRTRQRPAMDIGSFFADVGIAVSGGVCVGDLPEARFVWIDRPQDRSSMEQQRRARVSQPVKFDTPDAGGFNQPRVLAPADIVRGQRHPKRLAIATSVGPILGEDQAEIGVNGAVLRHRPAGGSAKKASRA